MRSEDLEAFREVVLAGGITAAAQRLGRSQSGVSRQLQRLEAAFGAHLLERGPSGVVTTPAGERVLDFAVDTLDGLQELRVDLGRSRSRRADTLRVAASTVPGEHLVPALVTAFADQHAEARIVVSVHDSAEVVRRLLQRRVDVGFTGSRVEHERLHYAAFATDEVVLAVPVGHPLAHCDEITAADLAGVRLLTREEGSGTQRTFSAALAQLGVTLEGSVDTISLGSTQAVLSAVDANLGVGIVSLRALASHRPERARAMRFQGARVTRTLWVVYEVGRARPSLHAAFIAAAESARTPA